MRKILFGITSLTLGGAERVLVDLANRISSDFDVTILTIYDNGILKSQLNDKVKVVSLYDKEFTKYSRIQILKISLKLLLFTKIPEGYDTYVAFLEGPITRLFSKKISTREYNRNIGVAKATNTINSSEEENDESLEPIKRIAWIHNDISRVFGNGIGAKIKKFFDKKIYQKYDKLIFVSKENQKDFNDTYGKEFNEEVIRNYLDYNSVIEKSKVDEKMPYDKNDINLLTVCRLEEQKAIDRFIKVHAKLEKEGIHCKVYIVGDGSQKYSLQKQIDRMNETDKFYLLGEKENPYPYIKNCDYFCLFSYYEGYGMVLDEAKILNKPIMITNTAAKESVENYEKAVVVENTEKGMFNGIKKALEDFEESNNSKTDEEKNYKRINDYYDKIIKNIERTIK